jgi:hypothetical protein
MKVLGDYSRQPQQSRMKLGLGLSRGLPPGERSGLLTHIATMESVSLCADEKVKTFVELGVIVLDSLTRFFPNST